MYGERERSEPPGLVCRIARAVYIIIIGERSEPPLSVELSEFSLYLYIIIYNYIYIYNIIYLFIMPLTRNTQMSDRPRRLRFNGQYNRLENGY